MKDGVRESCALTPRKEQPTRWNLLSVYLTALSIAINEISCFLWISCLVGLEESTQSKERCLTMGQEGGQLFLM